MPFSEAEAFTGPLIKNVRQIGKGMKQELQRNMRYLVEERKIISCIQAVWGGPDWEDGCAHGYLQESEKRGGLFCDKRIPLPKDAVFDLASVTKLFTCLLLVILSEEGRLNLSDPVGKYDPRFRGILDVPLLKLMRFQQALSTPVRIDRMPDRESAERELFRVEKAPEPDNRYYTDMGAMVLKYVAEAVLDMPFYEGIRSRILVPAGMHSTFCRVPEQDLGRTVCYNYERRCPGGAYTVDCNCPAGTVHDYKARILSGDGADLCGHAGLFSTAGDLVRLAQLLLAGGLISREAFFSVGVNRTGYRREDGSYTQHLGTLCFAKNPDQTFSEVPACFGKRTIALNGFTGNHFSIDPDRGLFMVILSNRIHNRVTVATGRANPYEKDEWIEWPDGKRYPLSQNYVYCKDHFLKEPIARILEKRESQT